MTAESDESFLPGSTQVILTSVDPPAPEPEPEEVQEAPSLAPDEIDAIDPAPSDVFVLSSGARVRVVPLKARQFFRLLRIVTRGGSQVWGMFRLSTDMEEGEFVSQLLGMVLFAIPEAESESFDFIESMLTPAPMDDQGNDRTPTKEDILALTAEVNEDLGLDDIVSIIEVVVRREGADLQALGKRLSALLGVAAKTGQLKGTPLSEVSQEPST